MPNSNYYSYDDIYGELNEVIYKVTQTKFRASLELLWVMKITRYMSYVEYMYLAHISSNACSLLPYIMAQPHVYTQLKFNIAGTQCIIT